MKVKEFKDLKVKDVKELNKLMVEKKLELMKVIPNMAVNQEKNLKKGKTLKTEIAQIMTILREKELAEETK